MAAEIFRRYALQHPLLKGSDYRRCKGIIHADKGVVLVGNVGECFYVEYLKTGLVGFQKDDIYALFQQRRQLINCCQHF